MNLFAMFKRTPFVNIRNPDINSFFYNITNSNGDFLPVALESIHIQSIEGFPNSLQAQITLLPFESSILQDGFQALRSWADVQEQQSLLYDDKLLSNQSFRQECKVRWYELREKNWQNDIIMDILSDIYYEIYNTLSIDINMWNMRSPILFREERKNDINKSIKLLFDWINERLEKCDHYFSTI